MKTGIKVFDEQEFQPGDVVVLTGFTGSGKSFLSTALALGLAQDGADVLHVDLEHTKMGWSKRVRGLNGGDEEPPNLRHRGMTDGAFSPSEFGSAAVVLDHIGLLAPKDEIHEFARIAKVYAVRQKTVVVIVTQLKRELNVQLRTEGWVDPAKLPEWVLEFGDQVFFLFRPHEDFRVVRAKDQLLHKKPSVGASFVLDRDGRLRQSA